MAEEFNIPSADFFDQTTGMYDEFTLPQFGKSNPNAIGTMAQMSNKYLDGEDLPVATYVAMAEQEGGEDAIREQIDLKEKAMVEGDMQALMSEFLAEGKEQDFFEYLVNETISSSDMLRRTNLERNTAAYLTTTKLADEVAEVYHTNEDGELDDEKLSLAEARVAINIMINDKKAEWEKAFAEQGIVAKSADVLALIFRPLGNRAAWNEGGMSISPSELLGTSLERMQEKLRTALPKEKVALWREYLDVMENAGNLVRSMDMLKELQEAANPVQVELTNVLELVDFLDFGSLGATGGVKAVKGIRDVGKLGDKPINIAKASGARSAAVDVETSAAIKAAEDANVTADVSETGIEGVLYSALKGNNLEDFADTAGEVNGKVTELRSQFQEVLEETFLPARLTQDEVGEAAEAARLALREDVGGNVDVGLIDVKVQRVGNTQMATFSLGSTNQPFALKRSAEAFAARAYPNLPTKVVDNGDGWIITTSRELSEKGFVAGLESRTDLGKHIPVIGTLTRRLVGARSQQLTSDSAKAILGQNVASRLQKTFSEAQKIIGKLSPPAQTRFLALAEHMHEQERWLSHVELKSFYRTRFNKELTEKDVNAYQAYILANNADYYVRNSAIRGDLVRNGYKSVNLDGEHVGVGKIVTHPRSDNSLLTVYDAIEGRFYKTGQVNDELIKKGNAKGNVLIEIPTGFRKQGENGGFAQYVIANKSSFKQEEVPLRVLNYQEGGHRYYKGEFFVKQQRLFNLSAGSAVIGRPKTLWNFENKRDAEAIVERVNKIIEAVKKADKDGDQAAATRVIQDNMPQWGGYRRVKELQKEGVLLDTPLEVVKSGEAPLHGKVGARFLQNDFNDMDSESLQAFDSNRLWFQESRGEHIRTFVDGDPRQIEKAPLLDPISAMERSINQATRMFGFEDYKTASVEKWMATYGQHIDSTESGTVNRFMNSKLGDGLTSAEKTQAEAWRDAIKRTILTPTIDEVKVREATDSLLEWMEPKNTKGLTNKMRDWGVRKARDAQSTNPVTAIKGLVFDHFMAIDPSQLFVQLSMMPGVMAVAGLKNGPRSLASYALLRTTRENSSPEVIARLAKVSQKVGGLDEATFKALAKDMNQSGVLNVVDTQADIATFGKNSLVHNPFLSKGASYLRTGRHYARWFFTEAERGNKGISYSIAWLENNARTGKIGIQNADEAAWVAGRAEALAGNMTTASRAMWQRGAMSIPTQFQAHPFRVAELMLTNNAGFSATDKTKFMAGLTLFYGAGSIPLGKEMVSAFQDWYVEKYGERPDDTTYRTMMDGVLGYAMSEWDAIPKIDISRMQTFSNPDQNIIFQAVFGDKTFSEVAFGPAGSVGGKYIDDFKAAMWVKGLFTGHVRFSDVPILASDAAVEVARNIAGVNRAVQASILADLHEIQDSKGRPIVKVDDPSVGQIIGTALGFRPTSESLTFEALEFKEEFDEKLSVYSENIYRAMKEINRVVKEDADSDKVERAQRKLEIWHRMIDSFANGKEPGGVIRMRIMERALRKLSKEGTLSENLQNYLRKLDVNWRINNG